MGVQPGSRSWWTIAAAFVVASVALSSACASGQGGAGGVRGTEVDGSSSSSSSSSSSTSASLPEPTPTPGDPPRSDPTLTTLIDRLTVAPEYSSVPYDRDDIAGWFDADGDGCDTRCEVLAAERTGTLPGLPGGGWLSAYENYSTNDPGELDIDHVVALSEAWRSGASEWSAIKRVLFANDLEEPASLIAVTASTNRSKGDRDPASWQPPNRGYWCEYARAWVTVKLRWGLSADDAEVEALRNMSIGC